ncbi:MAG: hypothetical protein R3F20_16100 [Planctomycetota bacterium]
MKILSLLGALLIASTAVAQTETAPAPAPALVKFKARPFVVGDKAAVSSKVKVTMNVSVTVGGMEQGAQSQSQDETNQHGLEVLGVDKNGVVNKAKVTTTKWDKLEKTEAPMQAPSETGLSAGQTALVGKTVIIDASQSPAAVTDEEGKAVDDETAKAARKQYLQDDGTFKAFSDRIAKTVPAEMRIGETIKLDGAQVAALVGADGEDADLGDPKDVFSGTLTLKEVRNVLGNEVGVFDLVTKMTGGQELPFTISGDPKGEILIGVNDKYLYKMAVKGQIKVEGGQTIDAGDEQIEIAFTGGGDVDVNGGAIYSKKK